MFSVQAFIQNITRLFVNARISKSYYKGGYYVKKVLTL